MQYRRSPIRPLYTLCVMLALALLLMACGGDNKTPTPSAQQLIKDAQTAIQKVTAYHFNLKAENIGTDSTLPIQSADGDIVVPDKLQANANVLFSGAVVQAQIVAIGDDEYLNILGTWQKTSELLDPRVLSDPQTGVSAILGHLQNPSTPVDSTTNNTPCWSITGKLDASYLAGITGGGAPAGTLDDVTTCIGKSDKLPYLILIKGISATGDTTQTTRTLALSKFNEHITINAPTIASTVSSPLL
jgi:LppX_LprAFG lipoprotein